MVALPLATLQASAAESGLHESLRLLDLPPAWIVVLVILPLFALATWVGYGRETLSTPMRALLSGLRMAAFVLLFLVLARPVVVERREEVHPPEVIVLLDDSASMRRRDTYSGDRSTRRALQDLAGVPPAERTRLELAQSALSEELLPVLARGGYKVRLFGFAEGATPLSGPEAASGRGAGTHLGDATTQVLASHRGRHVTDVVVLSDGRSNGGLPVLEAARSAGAIGVPVHTLVVGDTRPEKNAIVELVEAPGAALEGDELAVTVRVLARGVTDIRSVQAVLEELDGEGVAVRTVGEQEVTLSADGERVVLVAPSVEADLRTGERRFRVSVPPLDGETMTDDNHVEFSVHVSPARMRVLYVDGYPRWEYRYLKNLLLRADRNLDVQCFLLSATPDFLQESSRHLPSLRSVPATRQELLDNYDVIILGDVNLHAISPDPMQNEAFLVAVREFVEAGGGILLQAGEWYNPKTFARTPLEDVLPVVLDSSGLSTFNSTQREFRPLLEEPSNPHEILRLHSDPAINRRLWEDPEEGLRGFYWHAPVAKAKPGATVLLRHPWERSQQTGETHPLLVLGYYPAGRTMFLAVDSTWMWRYHYGDRYHETFWRNAIRWLALGRLKSGDRRYRIETSRSSYDIEDRVVFEARVLDEDFRPSQRPSQKVYWSGPEGSIQEIELALSRDRAGAYRGGLQVDRPGLYRAWIQVGGQRVSATEFEVRLPSRENADPSPNPQAMRLLASKTGGRALDLANVAVLADEFPGGEERRRRTP